LRLEGAPVRHGQTPGHQRPLADVEGRAGGRHQEGQPAGDRQGPLTSARGRGRLQADRRSDLTAPAIEARSMPASASCSAGVAEPGMPRTASWTTRGPRSETADRTASPSPPSGQWSSTVITLPEEIAAFRSTSASSGLIEYRSTTPT